MNKRKRRKTKEKQSCDQFLMSVDYSGEVIRLILSWVPLKDFYRFLILNKLFADEFSKRMTPIHRKQLGMDISKIKCLYCSFGKGKKNPHRRKCIGCSDKRSVTRCSIGFTKCVVCKITKCKECVSQCYGCGFVYCTKPRIRKKGYFPQEIAEMEEIEKTSKIHEGLRTIYEISKVHRYVRTIKVKSKYDKLFQNELDICYKKNGNGKICSKRNCKRFTCRNCTIKCDVCKKSPFCCMIHVHKHIKIKN